MRCVIKKQIHTGCSEEYQKWQSLVISVKKMNRNLMSTG